MSPRRSSPTRRPRREATLESHPPVRVERLAAGGDGVSRLESGKTLFLPRTAPGDLVEVGPIRHHTRFARARMARLLEPSARRTEPPCAHYVADDCGGCQWQHLTPEAQREAKRILVVDAFQRIGGLELDVPPVVPSDRDLGYRTRITLAVGPGRRLAGFHPVDRPDRVFDLKRCEIASPEVNALWQRVRPHLHLLPPDAEQLTLRAGRDGAAHLVVHARGDQAWTRGPRLAEALDGGTVTLWWHPRGGVARVVAGSKEMGFAPVFEQVNPVLGDRIRSLAVELLHPARDERVWDLYAGTGETSEALARHGARVESVELDPVAVAIARRRLAETGQVTLHEGAAEMVVTSLPPPDGVIANPPRSGLAPPVIRALLERAAPRVVYVSCDPATLARDAGSLCRDGRYRVGRVQAFDLFPQTSHVETVALLEVA